MKLANGENGLWINVFELHFYHAYLLMIRYDERNLIFHAVLIVLFSMELEMYVVASPSENSYFVLNIHC
jgi:hypothetical protein